MGINGLLLEKGELEKEINEYKKEGESKTPESRLNEIAHITQIIKNHPLCYDESLIRQILECVVVLSKTKIRIVFRDGTEIEQTLG